MSAAMVGKNEKIGIIGSGLIGRSWAMLFASVGYNVSLYDVQKSQVEKALADIAVQLKQLSENGLLKGELDVAEQLNKIKGADTIAECVKGAKYIQECTPENIDMKKDIFQKLDDLVDEGTILASSTSCLLPSAFTENLKHRRNALVAHPVNPPYYVPLVELVPAPWTDPQILQKTKELMEEIGQAPVTLRKEIDGFILNRIQYAIIAEAWRLFEDGVVDSKDIDSVMTEGLGMRYAFLGPLENTHLNAEGIEEYMDKYESGIRRIANSFGPVPPMTGESLKKMSSELCGKISLEKLQEKRLWRDRRVAALAKLKKEAKKND